MSIELGVATFEGDNRAGDVYEQLEKLATDGKLEIEHAALVAKTKEGEVKIQDVGDVDAKHGAVFGAITGGLIGLLAGPAGAVIGAVAGAATGSVTANVADYGVSDDIINTIEEGLQPGGSALIAYVELTWAASVIDELEKAGATVVNQPLNGEKLSQ